MKKRPKPLRQGRSLFELCISPILGDQKTQIEQLTKLHKLRPAYTNISSYELKVGQIEIIPED